jgi:hypothetical protein
MKKTAVRLSLGAVLVASAGIAWLELGSPYRKIAAVRNEFERIQTGDSREDVFRKLSSARLSESRLSAPFWDDRKLETADERRIASSLGQRFDTFFLPVTFVVSFDSSGRVIGKHVYD